MGLGCLDLVADGKYVQGVKVGIWNYMNFGTVVAQGEHDTDGSLTGEWYFRDGRTKKEIGRAIYNKGELVSGTGTFPIGHDTCDIIEYLGMAWY